MMLKLTEHAGITTFLLYKHKKKKKKKHQVTFWYSELLKQIFEFSPIFRKKIAISDSACFMTS